MKRNAEGSKTKNTAGTAVMAVLWLIIWQAVYLLVDNDLLLPAPYQVLHSLWLLLCSTGFYVNCTATLWRCLCGIVFSFAFGALTAALSWKYGAVRVFLRLPVIALKSIPVMAVIIYALLLLTSGNVPIFVCFLMCFPVVYTNLLSGLDSMDRQYLELAQILMLSGRVRFRHLYVPAVLPAVKSSLFLIAGLSWKAVVAAEVLSVPRHSMGYHLLSSKIYFEIPELFAWIAAILVLSLLFERLIKKLIATIDLRGYEGSRILRPAGPNPAPLSKTVENTGILSNSNMRSITADIQIRVLCKSFGEKEILKAYSAVLLAGQTTALMAPSGMGKTTLLRILAGLDTADSGEIDGLAGKRVSFLFQEDRLLPWLNLYDNLALALCGGPAHADCKAADQSIKKMLSELELSDSMYKMPGELSGGMRSRAAMGRALLQPADLLLLDEPFKGLDDALRVRVMDRVAARLAGRTVLLVTHSAEDAQRLADTVLTLS